MSVQQRQDKALHPTAYSSVRSSLRFRRRVNSGVTRRACLIAIVIQNTIRFDELFQLGVLDTEMSKSGKRLTCGIIGGFIGAQTIGVLIGAIARAYPKIASGEAFGLEGAEAMIVIPIVLGLVLAGAIVGAVLGVLIASRWR